MLLNNLLNNISLITIFIVLLLAFFLLNASSKNKTANRLFSGFLILTAFDLSSFFSGSYAAVPLNFEVFRMSASLLIMPFFYLYVKAVCFADFRFTRKYCVLLIPFLFTNLLFISRFYLGDFSNSQIVSVPFKQLWEIRFFYILAEIQYVFYIILVFKVLKKYKKTYLENYTSPNNSAYKWLLQMTLLFLMAHCFVLLKSLVRYTDFALLINNLNVLLGLTALLISCWFVLKALNNPELFKGVDDAMLATDAAISVKKDQYLKTKQTDFQIELLKKHLSENKPYLDPSLTIQELARQVDIPVRDLSILINHHLDRHFFDFINDYRIEKAMQLLKNPDKNGMTVLEILYEVGFNSKSSFNTAFKKYTNQTPTQFRKS